MLNKGLPSVIADYVSSSVDLTNMIVGNTSIKPSRRKAGRSAAPTLFTITLDSALFEVDVPLEVLVAGLEARQLVYADDTTLFATHLPTMQDRVDKFFLVLMGLGLEINPKKCHLLYLCENKMKRFSYVRTKSVCTIDGVPVSVVGVNDSFQYLEVDFNYRGVIAHPLGPQDWLGSLDSAPLKPYYKYEILCNFLLPGLHFPSTFCRFSK